MANTINNIKNKIKKLKTRLEEVNEDIKLHNEYQAETFTKKLNLPEGYKVWRFNFIPYTQDAYFDVDKFDENDKPIFCTNTSVFYNGKTQVFSANKGTYGTIKSDEKDKITDYEVFVSILQNLKNLEKIIFSYYLDIQTLIVNHNSISNDIHDLEIQLREAEKEQFELDKIHYLDENNNVIEFDKSTTIQVRNSSRYIALKVEIIRRLPAGDYKIKYYQKDWNNEMISYDDYMKPWQIDALLRLRFKEIINAQEA